MKAIKIIGLLTGLSFVAYLIINAIQEIIIMYEANDDIDPFEMENKVFEQIANERKNRNDWYCYILNYCVRVCVYVVSNAQIY